MTMSKAFAQSSDSGGRIAIAGFGDWFACGIGVTTNSVESRCGVNVHEHPGVPRLGLVISYEKGRVVPHPQAIYGLSRLCLPHRLGKVALSIVECVLRTGGKASQN